MRWIISLILVVCFICTGIPFFISDSSISIEKEFIENTRSSTTFFVGGSGVGNFSSIQDAIDNSTKGDTIRVFDGIYYENLRISSRRSLIGNGTDRTTVHGNFIDAPLRIYSDWTNVSGIKFMGASTDKYMDNYAIYMNGDNNRISNCWTYYTRVGIHFNGDSNTIEACLFEQKNGTKDFGHRGIYVYGGENNHLLKNRIEYFYYGIQIFHRADKTRLTGNVIFWNDWTGVGLYGCENCIFKNNKFTHCGIDVDGEEIRSVESHQIDSSNLVNGLPFLYVARSSDKAYDSDFGQIIIANSSRIEIRNCDLSYCDAGAWISFSDNITITNCSFNGNNRYGISTYKSEYVRIIDSEFKDSNRYGILLTSTPHSSIITSSISDSKYGGIISHDSDGLHVTNISSNRNGGTGLYFKNTNNVVIYGSDFILNGDGGIDSFPTCNNVLIEDCVTNNNEYRGILVKADNLTIKNCIVSYNNHNNLVVYEAKDCQIIDTTIAYGNGTNKFLEAEDFQITGCTFYRNKFEALKFEPSCKNFEIYSNNFISNNQGGVQAYDDGTNINWFKSKSGNYWSDWTSPDSNNDGIVDYPYEPAGDNEDRDSYPLADPHNFIKEPENNEVLEDMLYKEQIEIKLIDPKLIVDFETSSDWLDFQQSRFLQGTPSNEDVGVHWVEISIIGENFTVKSNFTITVINVNDPPEIIKNYSNFSINEDSSDHHINFSRSFKDIDNDKLEFGVKCKNFTSNINPNGTLDIFPKENWNGKEIISIYAKDKEVQIS